MDRIIKCIDDITFELKEDFDFTWLQQYGTVFRVFDQQDSGNLCFGVVRGEKKLFIKYAGAPTMNYAGAPEKAILRLKNAIPVYERIHHPSLIKLINHLSLGSGYVMIFEWAEGECLNAHWDFHKYPKYSHPLSPNYKFNQLSQEQKLDCLNDIISLHELVARTGYVAIDFYDGSILYDFASNKTTICDIDFYEKSPYINEMGQMWGSSRFMSPEEYQKGAIIDEITNVFTLGAVAFEIFGDNKSRNLASWKASDQLFQVARKATNANRSERYPTICDFHNAWNEAI